MLKWWLLAATIVLEVAASLSLKAALENPAFYAIVWTGYLGAFALLSVILRLGMPVGVAYGIWAAAGVALTAVFSAVFFGEPLTPLMLVGIALIVGGVLLVEIGLQRAMAKRAAERVVIATEADA